MPLDPPALGIECHFSLDGLVLLSGVFDDIGWWRRHVRPDEHDLLVMAERIPEADLAGDDREVLFADLRALPAIVRASLVSAIHLAVRKADAVSFLWHEAKDTGGDVIVREEQGRMVIDVGLCVAPPPAS